MADKRYYLAVDIGASSGRHILGSVEDGKIVTEEIYRFENGFREENGSLVWDAEKLFAEVKNGLAECRKAGKIPSVTAIDTWGVDYVLIDRDGKEILPCMSYRDGETKNVVDKVHEIIPFEELFARTGIAKQSFNTIYQLYRDKLSGKLDGAERMLMMPEYLSYKLTGVMKNEYTNATTGGLVNAESKTWDDEIISRLGLKRSIFGELNEPCSVVGCLNEETKSEVGFDTTVILCPSHDTASAFAACPVEDTIYISSGTWSLIGTESPKPILTQSAMDAGFTNEGGIDCRFRFLKNIMGTWLFQCIRRDLGKKYSYDEMMEMARRSNYEKTFDCTDESLINPVSMIDAIRALLGEDAEIGDVLKSVYLSLAHSYDAAAKEIEKESGLITDKIFIVGGGSKDKYLNEMTEKITGKKVVTGLHEATALGNLISQIMYDKKITLAQARAMIFDSFLK